MSSNRVEDATTSTGPVAKSVDSAVQHTNDNSVISKRSSVKSGYFNDDYLRYFVRKPVRRAPLINRGYYLRMLVMSDLVEKCVNDLLTFSLSSIHSSENNQGKQKYDENNTKKTVQVLSLGAGFDTFAARHYKTDGWEKVFFYEVDFPDVMENKKKLMGTTPQGTFPFEENSTNSCRYHCLGFDLRDADTKLSSFLEKNNFDVSAPTVVYAECVMQYMLPEDSTKVVHWISTSLKSAFFITYDQIQPLDSFGAVMCRSLQRKCSPLLGIKDYASPFALATRATEQGMEEVLLASFYDLSRYYISGVERDRITALEGFDELEEWSEMCEHYAILCAKTKGATCKFPAHPALKKIVWGRENDGNKMNEEISSHSSDGITMDNNTHKHKYEKNIKLEEWPHMRFTREGYGNGGYHVEFSSTGTPILIGFGGILTRKGMSRDGSVFAHSLQDGDLKVIIVEGAKGEGTSTAVSAPGPLCFHSMARLKPWNYVIFGGRTNPGSALGEAYMLEVNLSSLATSETVTAKWTKLKKAVVNKTKNGGKIATATTVSEGDVAPVARYRHCCVAISETEILVLGGKQANGVLLNDIWIGEIKEGSCIEWTQVTLIGNNSDADGDIKVNDIIPPFCSTAAVVIGADNKDKCNQHKKVIISGGLTYDDVALNTVWEFDIEKRKLLKASWNLGTYGRFSHTMTEVEGRKLFILGGSGFAPKYFADSYPPLLVDSDSGKKSVLSLPEEISHTTLCRHSVIPLRPHPSGVVGIVGGGFMCFSFGNYALKPFVLRVATTDKRPIIFESEADDGVLMDQNVSLTFNGDESERSHNMSIFTYSSFLPRRREWKRNFVDVEYSVAAWKKAIFWNFPSVIRNMPIGSCADLWKKPEYLTSKMKGVSAAIHVAHGRYLDFVHKNFSFRHVPFPELVAHCFGKPCERSFSEIANSETWYYRSIGANMLTERSDFFKNYPTISEDFILPKEVVDHVLNPVTHHQSCFRINEGGSQLWTHYDIMDNILVNVVGRKRVILFPISQMNNLYFSGSSSPVLNLDCPDLKRFPRVIDALQNAQELILNPGDCLLMPGLWLHHITAIDSCISINLFYKRQSMVLAGDPYDPKDLYGNKDLLQMAAMRLRLLEMIRNSVQGVNPQQVPAEFTSLMLQQLIQDVEKLSMEHLCRSF